MREVACEEDQIRLRIESVDDIDGALERLCSCRIRRPGESDVCVAELHQVEWSDFLAVLSAEPSPHCRRRTAAGHCRGNRDQGSDAEGRAGDFQELASIELFVHCISRIWVRMQN